MAGGSGCSAQQAQPLTLAERTDALRLLPEPVEMQASSGGDAAADPRVHREPPAASPIRSLLELFSLQRLAPPRQAAVEVAREGAAECSLGAADTVPDLVPLVPEALHSDSEVEQAD